MLLVSRQLIEIDDLGNAAFAAGVANRAHSPTECREELGFWTLFITNGTLFHLLCA